MNYLSKKMVAKGAFYAFLGLSLLAGHAEAAAYGDFSDVPPGTVKYLDVAESSTTDSTPLYGAPTITGNLLDFDPSSFGAYAIGSGSADVTDGQLNFTVSAIDGKSIKSITVSEGGDFTFTGATPTASSLVVARAITIISILEVDGVALLNPIDLTSTKTFSADYASFGGAPVPDAGFWSIEDIIDIEGALAPGYNLGATKIEVAINNQLSAISDQGTISWIAKKDFNITVPSVPEPSSLMLLTASAVLAVRRRRAH